MDDILRKDVKLLKALQGISYKELAELLDITQSSFYCWLKGYYDFGDSRQQHLRTIIDNLWSE